MRVGIPGRILDYHRLSPLYGLRVSRYRRGYAVTSTPEGQERHLHEDEVVIERMFYAPSPPHLWDVGERETDRTSTGWLGQGCSTARLDPMHPFVQTLPSHDALFQVIRGNGRIHSSPGFLFGGIGLVTNCLTSFSV